LRYRITGNFCGQLWTAEIKIAEYYVKQMFDVRIYKSAQITFSNSNSSGSVKYLIRPNYYTQIKEKWYYINVYTTIKGYLAVT
jgi:hypothetical protein